MNLFIDKMLKVLNIALLTLSRRNNHVLMRISFKEFEKVFALITLDR